MRRTTSRVLPWEVGWSAAVLPASSSWTKAEPVPLMEAVVEKANMARAYRRVVANRGSPGADGMTVQQLAGHLKQYWPTLRERLLAGEYHPSPVRAVEMAVWMSVSYGWPTLTAEVDRHVKSGWGRPSRTATHTVSVVPRRIANNHGAAAVCGAGALSFASS